MKLEPGLSVTIRDPDRRSAPSALRASGTTTPQAQRQPATRSVTGLAERPGASPMSMVVLLSTGAINRASGAVTVDADGMPRATVIGNADGPYPLPPDPRLSRRLRRGKAAVPPSAHAERRVAACLFRCAPAAVPGGPDTGHASEAVMPCAQCPGALAPSMRHTHRVNA